MPLSDCNEASALTLTFIEYAIFLLIKTLYKNFEIFVK
jgi:hypothetical protein